MEFVSLGSKERHKVRRGVYTEVGNGGEVVQGSGLGGGDGGF